MNKHIKEGMNPWCLTVSGREDVLKDFCWRNE